MGLVLDEDGMLMLLFCLDYDGYSCMSKWDRFMETTEERN